MSRRRRTVLGLVALLGLAWLGAGACKRKEIPRYPGPAKLPTAAPYHPPPTRPVPTLKPGEPTPRPTLPR